MGCCFFFFDYLCVIELRVFEELVGELLDEVMESVCLGMLVGWFFGWCGIGWGVEYLVWKGFVEDDDNEECNKIDEKVMEYDVRCLGDYFLVIGLEGILWYVLFRFFLGDKGVRIGVKNYLFDLKSVCEKVLKKGWYEGIFLLLDFLNGKRVNYFFGEFFL